MKLNGGCGNFDQFRENNPQFLFVKIENPTENVMTSILIFNCCFEEIDKTKIHVTLLLINSYLLEKI